MSFIIYSVDLHVRIQNTQLVLSKILRRLMKRFIHEFGWDAKATEHLDCKMTKVVMSPKYSLAIIYR